MQAVIVSFDSLATCALGCYGNEWVETPHWDRLAATGILFDQHYADTIGPSTGMAWISGRHALAKAGSESTPSLGHRLRSAGIATQLLATGEISSWHRKTEFDALQALSGQQNADTLPDQVPFAQLVRAGLEAWQMSSNSAQKRLLWLHAPGPGVPPAGFEDLYVEDFEERGFQFEGLSDQQKAAHPGVYGGAVSLIDHWLGELISGMGEAASAEPTLLIVTAACGHNWPQLRSFRLQQSHPEKYLLCDQQMRAPLVMKVIGGDCFQEFNSFRCDRLVQTCDLYPTLLEWFNIETPVDDANAGRSWFREIVADVPKRSSLMMGDEQRLHAVRTSEWLLIQDRQTAPVAESQDLDQDLGIALFVKPDDLWDVNDVAGQQPEIVSDLLKINSPATS